VSWGLHVSVSVVQLTLSFYTPYLKKVLGTVSFVWQKYVTSNKLLIAQYSSAKETEDTTT
jgi:hypothetical protein